MKGDFSRITFDRRKHYTGVRLQQGRVQLDADWNEQLDIAGYLRRALARDLIGASGAPQNGGGFEIAVADNRPVISPGRYWVDGFLCENDAADELPLDRQPDLPGFMLPEEPGWYLAYLDVWEREISALDDPDLLELALGGPDTATRTRVVWQVRLLWLQQADETLKGKDVELPQPSWITPRLTLAARTRRPPEENQLYRVEVHTPGGLGSATFKWSRDNGSMAALIERPGSDPNNPNKLVIVRQIQGGGFEAGQWIEVTDEAKLLQGLPGALVQLATVSGQELSVVGWPGGGGAPALSGTPIVRRWDSSVADGEPVVRPAVNEGFLALEEGLEVRFEGPAGASLRASDYWTIPVRAAAGALWPQNGNGPAGKLPDGIEHHYAPLKLLKLNGGTWTEGETLRKSFQPSVTGIGEPMVRRSGDTMSGDLIINASLSVQRGVTIGDSQIDSGGLLMKNAPILPAIGQGDQSGIQFKDLPARSGLTSAFVRFFGDSQVSSQVTSPRLVLEVQDGASIALRTGATDALTINNGNVGIGTLRGTQKLHVEGGALFRSGTSATGVIIESSLTLRDGSQKAGRFLVSDSTGRATWQEVAQGIGAPVFLPQRLFVSRGAGAIEWTTYQLAADKVPAGARAVILEAQAAKAGPDAGDIDAWILIRSGQDDPTHILMRGRAASTGEAVAWSNQGMFSLKDNAFQYSVLGSGFDGGWEIIVVGYFP